MIPVGDGAVNAVIYLASGRGPHPTLLMLKGFPGNEQNVDLAQAARRDGWNVLTFHYRGSGGSRGGFSFGNAAQDAHAALSFLKIRGVAVKYRIDRARIALAGYSMGGFFAADTAADDPGVVGLFLIDAWDIGQTAKSLSTEQGRKEWHDGVAAALPPLNTTSEAALSTEMTAERTRFSLDPRIVAYGNRPLAVYGAARGNGEDNVRYMRSARAAGNHRVIGEVWTTDHLFSDKRTALARALVAWLDTIVPPHAATQH